MFWLTKIWNSIKLIFQDIYTVVYLLLVFVTVYKGLDVAVGTSDNFNRDIHVLFVTLSLLIIMSISKFIYYYIKHKGVKDGEDN